MVYRHIISLGMLSNEIIPLLEDGFPENLFQRRFPCSLPAVLSEKGSGGIRGLDFVRLLFRNKSATPDATFSERSSGDIGSPEALPGISVVEGGVHGYMASGQVAHRCKEQDSEAVESFCRNDREEWLDRIGTNDAEGCRLVSFLGVTYPFIAVVDLARERKPCPRLCGMDGLGLVDRSGGETGSRFDNEGFDFDESEVRSLG